MIGPSLTLDRELGQSSGRLGSGRARSSAAGQRLRSPFESCLSLVVLGGWEYVGRQINPVLFTYPTAVADAAVKMIASGELWKYLSQSLIVLFAG